MHNTCSKCKLNIQLCTAGKLLILQSLFTTTVKWAWATDNTPALIHLHLTDRYTVKSTSKSLFPCISHLNRGKPVLNSLLIYSSNTGRQSPSNIYSTPWSRKHATWGQNWDTHLLDENKVGPSGWLWRINISKEHWERNCREWREEFMTTDRLFPTFLKVKTSTLCPILVREGAALGS